MAGKVTGVGSEQDGLPLEQFERIYRTNEWGYGSGVGSLPLNNIKYMEFVQAFIENCDVRSVVDFGCGDWQFARFMDWKGASYLGLDIVPDLIERNRKSFGRAGVAFEIFNGLDNMPKADLLLCKDVFQHLPNRMVQSFLSTFKSTAKFLLITNDDQAAGGLNSDIESGGWRPIRLSYPPFSECAPIVLTWMTTWGGWKPTRKATCLINGSR